MSKRGVRATATVFLFMQNTRIMLLGGDNQDVLLGQLLETGKEAMKSNFELITRLGPTIAESEARMKDSKRSKKHRKSKYKLSQAKRYKKGARGEPQTERKSAAIMK